MAPTEWVGPVIPESTVVISKETADQEIARYDEAGDIVLESGSSLEQEINIGDVVVMGTSEVAPSGLLRRVTGMSTVDGKMVIQTAQASLTEAVESGSISEDITLSPGNTDSVVTAEGVTYLGTKDIETSFDFDLDLVLFDQDQDRLTEYDQVRLDGSIVLTAALEVELDIDKFDFNSFTFALRKEQVLDLKVSIGAGINFFEDKRTLATIYTSPIIVPIGLVPVVLQPQIEIILRTRIDGSFAVSFGYKIEETTRQGSRYADGAWNDINEDEKVIEAFTPSFSGEIEARAAVGNRASLKIYGVTGPYLTGYGFLEASAMGEPEGNDFRITAEVEAGASVSLGYFLEVFSHTFFDYESSWDVFTLGLWENSWLIGDPVENWTTIVENDFESYLIGVTPPTSGENDPFGIIKVQGGSAIISTGTLGLTSQVMLLQNTEGSYVNVVWQVENVTSGMLRVECVVSLNGYGSSLLTHTSDEDHGGHSVVLTTETGEIWAGGNGDTRQTVGTYSPGVPFGIRMDHYLASEDYVVTIDDELNGFQDDVPSGRLTRTNSHIPFTGIRIIALGVANYSSNSLTAGVYDRLSISISE